MTTDANGIQFPLSTEGRRSTSQTTKAVFAAALQVVAPDAARELVADETWRQRYPGYLRALTEGTLAHPDLAVATASAGLAEAWRSFELWRDGHGHALAAAMAAPSGRPPLATVSLEGRDARTPPRWWVPYRGERLEGDALLRQLDVWERAGVAEPSHAEALRLVQRHPEWLDLSDRTFALLGAAAEMGPLEWLMRWRARVAAVDLRRSRVWRRIVDAALAGNGRLLAPVPAGTPSGDPDAWLERAGADLLIEPPEIAAWLTGLEAPLDVGSYAYLDGERHTRVVMAMDAIAQSVATARPGSTLGYLATPTDLFAIPEAAALAAQAAYERRALPKRAVHGALRAASGGRLFDPAFRPLVESSAGGRYGTADCVILQQGPSYALAKRLQQWRAVVARASGQTVSINVAPSSTTHSVTKHPLLAAGFRGASAFGLEIFDPATTRALMAALWVHDLRNPTSAAQPSTSLRHPLELLMLGANHGGLWRLGYLPRSVLPFAALFGLVKRR